MATIRKTSKGHYHAQVRRRGWPQVTKTFRTKRDASDWALSIEDEMRRGVYIARQPAERLTVAAALDRYLEQVTPNKKASTQASDQKHAKILRTTLGAYSLAAITPAVAAKFRDDVLAAGLSRTTARLRLALLSHLFTVAIQEWQIGLPANPLRAIKPPRPDAARDRRLSPEEESRLLAEADAQTNPMLSHMIRFALATAMRGGEIRSLRASDVDLSARIALLRDTKNNESRTVPLSRTAIDAILGALAHPNRPSNCDPVFFGEPGRDGIIRGYEYAPAWERVRRRANLADLRFHDLRHEATSRLIESGLSDQEVAAITGHKSMQMLRRYTHLRSADLVARLDDAGL